MSTEAVLRRYEVEFICTPHLEQVKNLAGKNLDLNQGNYQRV